MSSWGPWSKISKLQQVRDFSFEADLKVAKNLKLDWIRESLGLDGLPRSRVRRIPNQGLSRSGKRPMILVTRKSLRVVLARFALCALCFVLCALRVLLARFAHQTSTL